jgi:hypothetical protein
MRKPLDLFCPGIKVLLAAMKLTTIASVIEALYFSNLLDSAGKSRGGLMLVAEPESLKSEMLKVLKPRTGVCYQDDLNVAKITRLRPLIATGHIGSLVLPEFQKIFERREDTAANTLGHLRSFVHDGIYESAHDEMYTISEPATCTLFGALTPTCFNKFIQSWTANGFARRVLWCHYRINAEEKEIIREAIRLNVRVELFSTMPFMVPIGTNIPSTATLAERAKIDALMWEHVELVKVPHRVEITRLMYWIYDVLKWEKAKKVIKADPMELCADFIPSLGGRVALELPDHLIAHLVKVRKQREAAEKCAQ